MSVDKLVDSTQLDADLTSVANAIRAKSGGSSQLAFPNGFVSEIGNISSGDPYTIARALLNNSATEYIDDTITELRRGAFYGCSKLSTIQVHNVEKIKYYTNYGNAAGAFAGTTVKTLALPKLRVSNAGTDGYRLFEACYSLQKIDLGSLFTSVPAVCFFNCTSLTTIVLRSTTRASLGGTNALNNTPFKSGGTGGTIYIPKSLYDHLGDGTSDDYKAATNWSTVDGYGTITWKSIESTHTDPNAPIDLTLYYADGTLIPTA